MNVWLVKPVEESHFRKACVWKRGDSKGKGNAKGKERKAKSKVESKGKEKERRREEKGREDPTASPCKETTLEGRNKTEYSNHRSRTLCLKLL